MPFYLRILLYGFFGFLVGLGIIEFWTWRTPELTSMATGDRTYAQLRLECMVTGACLFLVLGLLRDGSRWLQVPDREPKL